MALRALVRCGVAACAIAALVRPVAAQDAGRSLAPPPAAIPAPPPYPAPPPAAMPAPPPYPPPPGVAFAPPAASPAQEPPPPHASAAPVPPPQAPAQAEAQRTPDGPAVAPVEEALPRYAPPSGPRLSAAEVKTFMLGKRMSGIREDTGEAWYECVGEAGDTLFNIAGAVQAGFVEVGEDGTTCFTYPGEGYTSRSCFAVNADGPDIIFAEELSGIRFRVTATDTDFEECAAGLPVS